MTQHQRINRLASLLVALLLAFPNGAYAAEKKVRLRDAELRAKAEFLPEGGTFLARN